MNRYSPEVSAAIHALVEIAITTPREVADVFVNYQAHCDQVSVSIHIHGWKEDSTPDFDEYYYLSSAYFEKAKFLSLPARVRAHLAMLGEPQMATGADGRWIGHKLEETK